MVVAQLNISLVRKEFETLGDVFQWGVDIPLASETNINDIFSAVQLFVEGYSIPYRHEKSSFCNELHKRKSWKVYHYRM